MNFEQELRRATLKRINKKNILQVSRDTGVSYPILYGFVFSNKGISIKTVNKLWPFMQEDLLKKKKGGVL